MIKNIVLITLLLLVISNTLHASKPLIGIVGIASSNPRTAKISNALETHLTNIINSLGIFDVINTNLLKTELNKFNCLDENCIIRFAENAGLKLIISGFIEDKGGIIIINLSAYGINAPYFGKIVYSNRVMFPISYRGISSNEYNYIYEEHAANFLSMLLFKYRVQVFIKKMETGKIIIDYTNYINGVFDLYRYDNITSDKHSVRIYSKIGKIEVTENDIKKIDLNAGDINEGDFILASHEDKAEFLEEFYYGRKREIVYKDTSDIDTLFMMLYALMPIVAPIGYYSFGDFTGLSLWVMNTLPYLYLEYDGLINRPVIYRKDKKNIPRKSLAHYRFSIYMLFCGGMPIFVDLFSHQYLTLSSNYQG